MGYKNIKNYIHGLQSCASSKPTCFFLANNSTNGIHDSRLLPLQYYNGMKVYVKKAWELSL